MRCTICGKHIEGKPAEAWHGRLMCDACKAEGKKITKNRISNPDLEFHKLRGEETNLYYGVELETGVRRGSSHDVTWYLDHLPNLVWPKHDYSIYDGQGIARDGDIEIVSHPATFRWLKRYAKEWNKVLRLRKHGLISYSTRSCGMHVHMDKRGFDGKGHIERFGWFFYGNPNFAKFISGRRNAQLGWCSLRAYTHAPSWKDDVDYGYTDQRYVAVNLTEHTVEVRLFRGTLKPQAFWKNLELCEAVHRWTARSTEATRSGNVRSFLASIEGEPDFAHLNSWLASHKNRVQELVYA